MIDSLERISKGDTIVESEFIVSKYRVTRHYGGPEEGGWWYDRSEFDQIVALVTDEENAFVVARALNSLAKAQKRQPYGNYQGRYSVANNTDDVYYVDRDIVGEGDDTEEPRPHYE